MFSIYVQSSMSSEYEDAGDVPPENHILAHPPRITGVARQVVSFRHIALTNLTVKIQRNTMIRQIFT
jgi:hypothetical protein